MELVPLGIAGLLAVGGVVVARLRHRREEQAHRRLVARDAGLEPTAAPLGLDRVQLSLRWECLPEGDRHCGLERGVQGAVPVTLAGRSLRLECAAFRWWWEQQHHDRRHGRRYQRQGTTVAVVRLPARLPTPLRLRPESVLGRLGMTRGGHQLESSEFNRRFRVACADDHFAVRFLDAGMQATLTDAFAGRSLEIVDDVLVLAGSPAHRDDSLFGVVGELPAVRQDAARLVSAIPDQVWRHLGVGPDDGSDPGERPDALGERPSAAGPDAGSDPVGPALERWLAEPGWVDADGTPGHG